jgi:CubicO group peptidase (beta-lactamase class C family)
VTAPPHADPLREFFVDAVNDGWLPGAAWWVEARGRVVGHGAVGAAVVEPCRVDATEATPYDLASLTKPLATALLLVLLEQAGRVDLNARAAHWLPELRGSAFSGVSLLDLARHGAGLPAWRPLYLEAASRETVVERIAREPRVVEPGRVLYSDLGYMLLGAALERIEGVSLDRQFRYQIARPLGLPRLGFATDPRRFADAAATERGNAYERAMARDERGVHRWRTAILRGAVHDANAEALGGVAGHAGLFGTAEEVAAIARELIRPSRLNLGQRARERILEPAEDAAGRTVGCVTAAAAAAARGILPDPAPGHTGFTGTSVWLDPDNERVFVLLSNRVHPVVPQRGFHLLRRGFHRLAARRSGH